MTTPPARARKPGKKALDAENARLRAALEKIIDACDCNDWSEPGISDDLYNAKEQARAALEANDA